MDNRKFPQYIDMERSKQEKISQLTGQETSPFNKLSQKEVLFFAAAVGLHFNLKEPISNPVNAIVYKLLSQELKIIVDVVALKAHSFDTNSILDGKLVIETFEEYSNGGLSKLYSMVMNREEQSELEKEIFDILGMAQIKST